MNQWIGTGNLGSNPVLRHTDSGRSVTNFSIAVDRVYYKTEGNSKVRVEAVDWIPVVCWGTLADTVARYCQKGSLVGVKGELRQRSYEDDTGTTRRVFEIVADKVEFLSNIRSNADVASQQTAEA